MRGPVEYTMPDEPRSRMQRYRTTEAGLAVLKTRARTALMRIRGPERAVWHEVTKVARSCAIRQLMAPPEKARRSIGFRVEEGRPRYGVSRRRERRR